MFSSKKQAKRLAVHTSKELETERQLRSSKHKRFFRLSDKEKAINVADLSDSEPSEFDQHIALSPDSGLHSDQSIIAEHLVDSPLSVFLPNSDDADMAEASFVPAIFNGTPSEDAKMWLEGLNDYCQFRDLKDEKCLCLFKLRLGGYARDWLATLPDDKIATFQTLSAAFSQHFQPKEVEKYKYAQEIFSRKQADGESVDAFITRLTKQANLIGLDEKSVVFAALGGLRKEISQYIIEQQASPGETTLEQLMSLGRVAELTRSSQNRGNDAMAVQMELLSSQMAQIATKLSTMTTAAVATETRRVTFQQARSRSASPNRKVVANENSRPTKPWSYNQGQAKFREPAGNSYSSGNQRSTFQLCTKCGKERHVNPLSCPMLNKNCFACGKTGHAQRVCRSTKQQ